MRRMCQAGDVCGGFFALTPLQVMDGEPDTEITITVFRLLVLDLLALFQALNQAMISILGSLALLLYFEPWAYADHPYRPLLRDVEA
jgi:hypothetical protein